MENVIHPNISQGSTSSQEGTIIATPQSDVNFANSLNVESIPNNHPEDDLNQETWESALNISAPVGMPKPEDFSENETLNRGITSPAESIKSIKKESPTELGEITTLNNAISVAPVADQINYNPVNIKTTGDRLEKSSIAEIDTAIDKLNQTGNLNDFYNEIRGEGSMLEANLHNSFNRKLYHNEGKE